MFIIIFNYIFCYFTAFNFITPYYPNKFIKNSFI